MLLKKGEKKEKLNDKISSNYYILCQKHRLYLKMGMFMKASLKRDILMVKEYTNSKMEQFIMVISNKVPLMVLELSMILFLRSK